MATKETVKLKLPSHKVTAKEAEESKTDVEGMMDETKEDASGKENGVKVSEEFQKRVYELLDEATNAECDYVGTCCSERRSEIYDEERKAKGKDDDSEVSLSPED
jgi:ribosome recycling factor